MPLLLDDATTESLRLAGRALRQALSDGDLNRGSGRELRNQLLADSNARDALNILADEIGIRFFWSGDARLDVLPLPSSPFAYTKADLKALGVKDVHLFVAIVLGVAAFFYPEGDFAGDPFRQEGSLADIDEYLCDRMRQVRARPDLDRLDEAMRAEVSAFVDAWVERAQAAPGTGKLKSRFAELKRTLKFLEERRYLRLQGDRDEALRIYPAERLRVLAAQLGEARHYELLMKLLHSPTVQLPIDGIVEGPIAAATEEP